MVSQCAPEEFVVKEFVSFTTNLPVERQGRAKAKKLWQRGCGDVRGVGVLGAAILALAGSQVGFPHEA